MEIKDHVISQVILKLEICTTEKLLISQLILNEWEFSSYMKKYGYKVKNKIVTEMTFK